MVAVEAFQLNALGQKVGLPVEGWTTPPRPPNEVIEGRT